MSDDIDRRRCKVCGRPLATDEDFARYEDDPDCAEAVALCWSKWSGECDGEPVDWQARVLAATAEAAQLREALVAVEAQYVREAPHRWGCGCTGPPADGSPSCQTTTQMVRAALASSPARPDPTEAFAAFVVETCAALPDASGWGPGGAWRIEGAITRDAIKALAPAALVRKWRAEKGP